MVRLLDNEKTYDMLISLVNYKMKDEVFSCIASLKKDIEYSGLRVGIVVVDNNSGDGVGEALSVSHPDVLFLPLPDNIGMGAANNMAIRLRSATYYMVLNPDILFSKTSGCLRALFDFMEKNPKVGICGPELRNSDGSLQYSSWRFPTILQPLYSRTAFGRTRMGKENLHRYLMKDVDHTKVRPVDALMGSALCVRKTAADEVGLFDDGFFMYFEDIDWCLRMWEHGWAVYYVPTVSLIHAHGRGSAKVSGIFWPLLKNRLARTHVRSWIRFLWKWRGKRLRYERKT